MRERISELLPETTKIFIEKHFNNPESYDLYVEIVDGRIDGASVSAGPEDDDARQDLNRKLKIVAETELFHGLDRKQQRLLAFSGQWYNAKADQVIFKAGQRADAAYLCVSGLAALYWPSDDGESLFITDVKPGRLIGDLAVIRDVDRNMDLVAKEDSTFLRIGATELLSVIENDPMVATSLLRTVASHLTGAANRARELRDFAEAKGVDFSELEGFLQNVPR
jgi:putative ABC transport system ATP-binding protein